MLYALYKREKNAASQASHSGIRSFAYEQFSTETGIMRNLFSEQKFP